MEAEAVWPTGLLGEGASGTVSTAWGKVHVLPNDADLHALSSEGAWGHLPDLAKLNHAGHDRHGRWSVTHDGAHDVLHLCFGTNRRTSSLAQHADRAAALVEAGGLQLPVGGLIVEGNDAVLVYPASEPLGLEGGWREAFEQAGRLLGALAPWATPPTERRWNEEVAAVEGRLGSTTLWRAPHHRDTVGLPWIRLSLHHRVRTPEGPCFRLLPPTLDEALSLSEPRRPGLAYAAALEGEAVQAGLADQEGGPAAWFEAWRGTAPAAWSSDGAMSTYRGGLWIWRYADVLRWRARAVIWDEGDLMEATAAWLADVDRLQARLGALRMWRSLAWVGVAGGLVAWYGHALETFDAMGAMAVAVASLGVAAFGLLRYRLLEPKAF